MIIFFTYLEAAGTVPWSHRGLKNPSANRDMVGDISSASSTLYSLPKDQIKLHDSWTNLCMAKLVSALDHDSDPMLIQVLPCTSSFMNHEVWSDPMLIQVLPCTSFVHESWSLIWSNADTSFPCTSFVHESWSLIWSNADISFAMHEFVHESWSLIWSNADTSFSMHESIVKTTLTGLSILVLRESSTLNSMDTSWCGVWLLHKWNHRGWC